MGAKILNNRVVQMLAVPFIAFWIMVAFVERTLLVDIMNWCLVFTAFAVTGVYGRLAFEAIRTGRADRVAHLAIGITLSWIAVLMSRGWVSAYKLLDYEWMRESTVVAFYLFTYIMAGIYHITAPELIDGKIATRGYAVIAFSLTAGGFAAGMMAGLTWAGYRF